LHRSASCRSELAIQRACILSVAGYLASARLNRPLDAAPGVP
jgi:hypothetical protein